VECDALSFNISNDFAVFIFRAASFSNTFVYLATAVHGITSQTAVYKLVSRLIVIGYLMILGFRVWVQCVFRLLGVVPAYVTSVECESSICSPWLVRILVLCLTLHWH